MRELRVEMERCSLHANEVERLLVDESGVDPEDVIRGNLGWTLWCPDTAATRQILRRAGITWKVEK